MKLTKKDFASFLIMLSGALFIESTHLAREAGYGYLSSPFILMMIFSFIAFTSGDRLYDKHIVEVQRDMIEKCKEVIRD